MSQISYSRPKHSFDQDCFILAPSLSLKQVDHKTASDDGFLSIFSHTLTTFLPITIDHDMSNDDLINVVVGRACEGVRDVMSEGIIRNRNSLGDFTE